MRSWARSGLALVVATLPAGAWAKDKSEPVHVVGNVAGFFSPNAYPPEAVRAGEQGRVVAAVAIDAAGQPTGCNITISSNSVSLDATTCSIAMTKIHYVAARDARGRSVSGSYDLKVRWVLPQPPPGINRALVTFSGTASDPICSVVIANVTRHLLPGICHGLATAVAKRQGNVSEPVFLDIPEHSGFLLPEVQ